MSKRELKLICFNAVIFIIVLCAVWGTVSALRFHKELNKWEILPFNEELYGAYNNQTEGESVYDFSPSQLTGSESLEILSVDNYRGKVLLWKADTGDLVLHVKAEEAGVYEMRMEYQPLIRDNKQIIVALKVNGEEETGYKDIRLPVRYRYKNYEFQRNKKGNHIFPQQELVDTFMCETLTYGITSYDPSPVRVRLNQGENEIRLKLNSGSLYLGKISLMKQDEPVDFDTYKANIKESHPEARVSSSKEAGGNVYLLEAEQFYYKNSIDISIAAKSNYLLSPYETNKVLLNCIDGETFKNSGDQLVYYIEIENPGFYYIGIRGFMPDKHNSPVFMDVKVDGKIPYREMQQARFEYSQALENKLLPTPVYLNKGVHQIEFVLNGKPYYEAGSKIETITEEINQLAMKIKKLTGNNQDKNRQWDLNEYLPDLESDLIQWMNTLKEVEGILLNITKGKRTEEIQNIRFAMSQLSKLMKDPNKIPSKLSILSQGSSSVLEILSKVLLTINLQKFSMDQIIVTSSVDGLPTDSKNLLYSVYEGVRRFVKSFDKAEEKATDEDNTINIWMKSSRQYLDVLQSLVYESFTEKTGINVRLSLITDQGKLTLANAADKQPDGVLGIDSYYVNDLALRGSLTNLREFDGINKVLENVAPGSLLQMIIDDKLYGLPQTQDFYVLFYRKDIFEEFGFKVPDTWDDVLLMLPALQRNGMNFYTPLSSDTAFKSWPSTMPFYAQFHADIYKADGSATVIDSEEGLQAMKFMTDLYMIYGLPIQIKSFYNNFRFGETPIGIGNFSTYIEIKNGAPEINNRWGIALMPGRIHEDGKIERWCTGGSQAVAIFEKSKKKEKAWEFMQWWLSEEIQAEYTKRLQNIYGKEYLWNSGNLKALSQMPIDEDDLEVIMEQVKWIKEAPRIPGGYYTEREISNAWNKIVFDGFDVRTAVDDAVIISNRETTRKLEEFGYMKNGIMVKPYKVPTIEDVERWLQDE